MRVQEFPLAWRWTDSRYAVLPEAVLSQLQPLGVEESLLAFEHAQSFPQGSGVTYSADVSDGDGCAWLRAQHPGLRDIVTISGRSAVRCAPVGRFSPSTGATFVIRPLTMLRCGQIRIVGYCSTTMRNSLSLSRELWPKHAEADEQFGFS